MTGPVTQNELNLTPASDTLHARHAALGVVDMVLTRRVPFDQALEDNAELPLLAVRDRAFARMLATTVLRRLGQIDDILCRAGDRGELPQPPLLCHVLRLGVAQVLFMDVPDHAAVNTTVELAEQAGLARQKGFANAVMRRVTRDARQWLVAQDDSRLNTPEWLLKEWIADYGVRGAADIGVAHLAEAPLDISVKDPAQLRHWAEMLDAAILPTGSLRRVAGGTVDGLPGFHDGAWWVQDAAAALPARLFGDLNGAAVVDLCAAPGGKTAQLAAAGAQVTALDRSAKRLQRLADNIRRLNLDHAVRTEAVDAAVWRPHQPVQAVLLDAPCTATGTIRRHPDVAILKTPRDMTSLVDVQARLLDNALTMLAPGGVLVYCTCSLQKAEGERQIDALLARAQGRVARLPVTAAELGGLDDAITPDGDVRILPTHLAALGGMDGFFAARLRRIG